MEGSAKYLIHADVTANGVVEREDVVGAVYGQTEGLLGEELDLRYLQEASKVGRIDVDVDSERGSSFGEVTIATSMDRVETAVLAASLETIGQVGPCRAEFRVRAIEDVRAAKRREIVERAKELLAESFDAPAASSREILEEVRRAVRVEDVDEYEGLPAGPNVADSDAIVVVEGRADVRQLLEYGIKNAVAVEGTGVPDAVAELTTDRTVTAFLDGDRGGDLIRKELAQVGEVDYVALTPPDRSVEDLSRQEVRTALQEKVPHDQLESGGADAAVPTDGGTVTGASGESRTSPSGPDADVAGPGAANPGVTDAAAGGPADAASTPDEVPASDTASASDATPDSVGDEPPVAGSGSAAGDAATAGDDPDESTGEAGTGRPAETLREHVAAVVGEDGATVRLLDDEFGVLAAAAADEAFEAVETADPVPAAVVLDGTLTQRVLDVAAQRGVGQIVARETGELVKQPVGVRIRTFDQLQ